MFMTTKARPSGASGGDAKADREAKLAAALRANLRRRKGEPARTDGSSDEAPKATGGDSS